MLNPIITKFIDWLDSTKAWEVFFKTLNQYNVRISGYPEFPVSDFFNIVDKSKPKCHYVFLSTDSKSLSSMAIKAAVKTAADKEGYYSHAGIILFDGDRNSKVFHVRAEGLVEQHMLDFLKTIDYLTVVKLPILPGSDTIIKERIDEIRGRSSEIKYDWEQNMSNDKNLIYCSELIYNVYKGLVDSANFKPREILGRPVFDPDLLLQCGETIYNNHPKLPILR
jgi:hypothetical protein